MNIFLSWFAWTDYTFGIDFTSVDLCQNKYRFITDKESISLYIRNHELFNITVFENTLPGLPPESILETLKQTHIAHTMIFAKESKKNVFNKGDKVMVKGYSFYFIVKDFREDNNTYYLESSFGNLIQGVKENDITLHITESSNEKGLRYNSNKLKWSLVHFKSLEPMVRVLEFGAKKYTPDNWKKGLDKKEILESILRHTADLMDGKEIDEESGLPIMGHIQCNAMFYNYFYTNKTITNEDVHSMIAKLEQGIS